MWVYNFKCFCAFFVGVGKCLNCLIFKVVKLLTGFEAIVSFVKDFTLGVSVVILDGASIVQMLKVVEVSTVQCAVYEDVFKQYVISTFCTAARVDLVWSTYKAVKSINKERTRKRHFPAVPKNWQDCE